VVKVSAEIQSLKPYIPGKPIGETMREYGLNKVYKLASNENPLGPSPKAVEAVKMALSELHRYPDAAFFDLRQTMSKYYDVAPEFLTFGNGSNELIDLLIRIFCEPGESILTSQAAFIAYKICAQAARVNTIETPLTTGMRFDLKAMSEKVQSGVRLIFIANPNNPTGTYVTAKELDEFLMSLPKEDPPLVVLDEAYCEFVRAADYPDSINIVKRHSNVIVLRTLSKVYGLAALRVGTMVAHPEVIDFVDRVRNPFNVNSLAQVAAIAAVTDAQFLTEAQKVNWQGLDYFYDELSKMGLEHWPSQGNFVLLDSKLDSSELHEQLLQQGVVLRPVKGYGLPTHMRMSVGLPEENHAAIEALKKVL